MAWLAEKYTPATVVFPGVAPSATNSSCSRPSMPLGHVASRFSGVFWFDSVMVIAALKGAIFLYIANEFTSYDNLMVDR